MVVKNMFKIKIMKIKLLIFILMLFTFNSFPQAVLNNGTWANLQFSPTAPPPTPDILTQDFETGTIPSGWTVDAANPKWNYTPALLGSYSLQMTNTVAIDSNIPIATNEVYVYFLFRMTALPAVNSVLFQLRDSTYTTLLSVVVKTTGELQLDDETHYPTTTGTMSAATTYSVWIRYTKGTGANAVFSGEFQTTATQVGSGPNFCSENTGVATGTVSHPYWQDSASGAASSLIIDHLGIATFNMPGGW
jgi:hypothetical protein